jgi:hypothetical protein
MVLVMILLRADAGHSPTDGLMLVMIQLTADAGHDPADG